jgi:hypothetical protein
VSFVKMFDMEMHKLFAIVHEPYRKWAMTFKQRGRDAYLRGVVSQWLEGKSVLLFGLGVCRRVPRYCHSFQGLDQFCLSATIILRIVKNGVFWDVTPCGSCNNRRFRGT